MSQTQHACPKPEQGKLPLIIHDAAVKGNMSEVLTWLEEGGDINAADMNNDTLVFTACNHNHVQLLKELLKRPKVHLNQLTIGGDNVLISSPMGIACMKANTDCIEALITSPSECKIDLVKNVGCVSKAIILAAALYRWDIVELILRTDYILEENDACYLTKSALQDNKMSTIKDMVARVSTFYKNEAISNILQEIYKKCLWDEVNAEAIFRKSVLKSNDFEKDVLLLVLEKNDWNKLEMLLRIMNDAVKIDINLAEAILNKASKDVERMLAQKHMEVDVMNGALLVASIGGTSEQIVGMLFGQKHNYSAEILDNVLILACKNSRLELLPTLLRRKSFSYEMLSRSRCTADHFAVQELVDRAMKKSAKEIIPLKLEDEYEIIHTNLLEQITINDKKK